MDNPFGNAFQDTTVFITGHTGFKGSWLAAWLVRLGARVVGYSLHAPASEPSNYDVSGLAAHVTDVRGDVRDADALRQALAAHQPALVIHMAAQPLVLRGVAEPELTFDTNAGGTVNVLDAVRHVPAVRAVINITTDKVYHNNEWLWGYREADRLGGHDPY
ncbi:MAG: GDP-mannose 4,6-dehydratase, partial [Anaerolineales bacterium]|nr:GDP-mannose 4,6-dehydratase [Anaerolineales bacterium]